MWHKLHDICFMYIDTAQFKTLTSTNKHICQKTLGIWPTLYDPMTIQNIDYAFLKELNINCPTQEFMTYAFNTFINLERFGCKNYINPNVEKLTQNNLKLKHLKFSKNNDTVYYKNLYPSLDTLDLTSSTGCSACLCMCPNVKVLMINA